MYKHAASLCFLHKCLTYLCLAQVQVNKDRELSISGERRQRSFTASPSSPSDDGEVQASESSKASASEVQRKRQEPPIWNIQKDMESARRCRCLADQGVSRAGRPYFGDQQGSTCRA